MNSSNTAQAEGPSAHPQAATLEFRGTTIAKSQAWGQGPVLLQALAILDTFDDDRLDPSTALGIHTITEGVPMLLDEATKTSKT